MWITSSLSTAKTPIAVALGNFDGVHLGHRGVIQPILKLGDCATLDYPDNLEIFEPESAALAALQGYSDCKGRLIQPFSDFASHQAPPERDQSESARPFVTVLTFFPHPQEFFTGRSRPLLTPLHEKALQLKQMGVEQLVLLPFNRELAELSPQAFVETVLIQKLQARRISVGVDFRFGHRRAGSSEDLQAIATDYKIPVSIVPLKFCDNERISSSRIRQALQMGNLTQAEKLLGRPYSLTGRVVQGQQLGRTLGFPTANLKLPPEKFTPSNGVYSVKVYVASASLQSTPPLPGVMNIGYRPTVDGQTLTVEVHLLNWSGDLYGQTLTVSLEAFLRPEQKFDSLDSLKAQIHRDCEAATSRLMVGDLT
ncbi:MAG: bifunctional riboflavin kinase/FAD synthetase [Leptolyngbyaceae cyanobacterium MO_188.B28]|nr:bifunctional riboflavin kinase/FAD synthetase [Leptolyngbyaceae cyanobacterium MO_188.B28]